jgi:AraC-like DNA-binding protein
MKAILEQIRTSADHSFTSVHYATSRFDCPYHYHPEIELTLIVAGRGQRLIGDHLAPFSAGDLVLMGSELPHSYFHPPDFDDGPHGASSIVLLLPPEMLGGVISSAPEFQAVRRLLQKSSRGLTFSPAERARVAALMPEIIATPGLPKLILLLQALHILAHDRRAQPLAGADFHPAFNQRQASRIERVSTWMASHFCEPITLDQAAQVASLTPTAFSRFFRRATNRPFIRFLNELRIRHACRLLLETETSIADIAFASGFENLSNFNRHFQHLLAMTPRQYRSARAEVPPDFLYS